MLVFCRGSVCKNGIIKYYSQKRGGGRGRKKGKKQYKTKHFYNSRDVRTDLFTEN